ncbi:MAG: sulfite exporter TauE/SafE family protein [Chloroflexi bacterium]|nr:sulfite exporter TauE/SafE family protein [Chloroflexota bacterium]
MTAPSVFLAVVVIGGLAQLIDGSLGMGFGVFSASLMIATGFAPAVAVAVVNAAKVLTGLASGLSHWSLGNVRRDWLLPLAVGGVVGGFLGGYALTSVSPATAKPWISLLLLGMGLLIVWRAVRRHAPCDIGGWDKQCENCPRGSLRWLVERARNGSQGKLGLVGFVAGFVNGLSGAYGPIATSSVLLIEKGQPRHAIGTVNLAEVFAAATVAGTILIRQGLGQFPVGLVVALALGGIVAAPLAAYICRRLPAKGLAFMTGSLLIGLNFNVVTRIWH